MPIINIDIEEGEHDIDLIKDGLSGGLDSQNVVDIQNMVGGRSLGVYEGETENSSQIRARGLEDELSIWVSLNLDAPFREVLDLLPTVGDLLAEALDG